MTQNTQLPPPQLIIITGRPGSGKTTLAHKLAPAVRCPLISRDELKEGLVHTINKTDASPAIDLNLHVYHAFFDAVTFLLKHHISLMIEAAFQHKLWQPRLTDLQQLAEIKMIVCEVDITLAKSRFIQRSLSDPDRAHFHEDWSQSTSQQRHWLDKSYQPPECAVPTLKVDTSNGYQPAFEEIVSFATSR